MNYQIEKVDLSPARLKMYATAIKYGENQAVTQRELENHWGCSDRAVRKIVAALRENHVGDGVLVAGQTGYWYTCNPVAIRQWIMIARKKARSLEHIADGAAMVLRELEDK